LWEKFTFKFIVDFITDRKRDETRFLSVSFLRVIKQIDRKRDFLSDKERKRDEVVRGNEIKRDFLSVSLRDKT